MKSHITLCMIVRNEEASLDRCLSSVEGVADEIVIVDTGSTDGTAEIARRHGAKIFVHEWKNDFSEARNAALDSASGEWILVLDADEELEGETQKKMRGVVDAAAADGIEMTVRSLMPEYDVLKYEDTGIVRLFRNDKNYRYVMPVHEQIRSSIEKNGGVIIRSDLVIAHYGYMKRSVQGKEDRAARNLTILNQAALRFPDNPYFRYQIGVTLMSLGRKDEAYRELKKVLDLDYARMGSAILDRFFMKISQLALDKDDNESAVRYADNSLEYNPQNGISMYVKAVGLLSAGRIREGYQILTDISKSPRSNLRLDMQIEHLIKACRQLLNI
ncbi:MAG: glycosyltransferase [Bacteroidetes bacterium]|nr:glycosyltransferase [Bacteroidota bacterium]